jgi:cell division septation protein DedD
MKRTVMLLFALWLVLGPFPFTSQSDRGPVFAGPGLGQEAFPDSRWTLRWREPRVRAIVPRHAPEPVAPAYEPPPAPGGLEEPFVLDEPSAAPAMAAAPEPVPVTKTDFVLQIAAFRSYENARALQNRLSLRYPGVYLTKFQLRGVPFHRVRVGAFQSDTELASTESSLRRDGFTPIRVRAGGEDL